LLPSTITVPNGIVRVLLSPPKEFSVKNMGVRDQTPVADVIHGLQWKYGSEAETTGTGNPSSTTRPAELNIR
jgi:hypothetical protein